MMLNTYGTVIYVGKAKNLKNRIKNYFTGSHNAKTAQLVAEISDFNYVITNSEQESLLLEYNLIKQYKPRYNIRLIDDKSYPYLEITKEKYPRLLLVRLKDVNPKRNLFGPYPNGYAAKETLNLLYKLYPLRRCHPLQKNACLYYSINQCLGPCINPEVDFKANIEAITNFLRGDVAKVLKDLKVKMNEAAQNLNFEMALEYKELIQHVENTVEKQIVSLNDHTDKDFIAYVNNEEKIAISIINMRQGRIMDTHQTVFSYVGEVQDSVINYIVSYYEKVLVPKEIDVASNIDVNNLKVLLNHHHIYIPLKGDKKKLIDLCLENSLNDLNYQNKVKEARFVKYQNALSALEEIINFSVKHIEVFDNAHLFGVAPISGMIVFKDFNLEKKEYRKFNLTSTNNDDYQAIYEVLYRRYHKVLIENQPLPDLIAVDGAKGQVNMALKALNELGLDIKVIGLKKNKQHELSGLIFDNKEYELVKGSPLYGLMALLSEEVHRYTLAFHRQSRSRKTYLSVLDQVKGIGQVKKQILLDNFTSLTEIKNASVEKLRSLGLSDKVIKQIKESAK